MSFWSDSELLLVFGWAVRSVWGELLTDNKGSFEL